MDEDEWFEVNNAQVGSPAPGSPVPASAEEPPDIGKCKGAPKAPDVCIAPGVQPPRVDSGWLDFMRRKARVVKSSRGGCYLVVDGDEKINQPAFSFLVPQTFATIRDLLPPPGDRLSDCIDGDLYSFVSMVVGAGDKAMERALITDRNERTQRPMAPVGGGGARARAERARDGLFTAEDLEEGGGMARADEADGRVSKRMRMAMEVSQQRSNHGDFDFTMRHAEGMEPTKFRVMQKHDIEVEMQSIPRLTRYAAKVQRIDDADAYTPSFLYAVREGRRIMEERCGALVARVRRAMSLPPKGLADCPLSDTFRCGTIVQLGAQQISCKEGSVPIWFENLLTFFMVRHALRATGDADDEREPARYWAYDYTLDDVGAVASDMLGLSSVSDDDISSDDLERIGALAKVVSDLIALGMHELHARYKTMTNASDFLYGIIRGGSISEGCQGPFAHLVATLMMREETLKTQVRGRMPAGEVKEIERAVYSRTRELEIAAGERQPEAWLIASNTHMW